MFTIYVFQDEKGDEKVMFESIYELTNKPLEHTPPVISEDSLHNHLCSDGLLVRSWNQEHQGTINLVDSIKQIFGAATDLGFGEINGFGEALRFWWLKRGDDSNG